MVYSALPDFLMTDHPLVERRRAPTARAMERTDMATPEKINNQRQILNEQFSIPSQNLARPTLPACDALELTS